MRLFRRLWFVITRRQREDDLADEMAFHRQMKADALRRDGVPESDVASTTQRALGNDLLARERARDVWIPPWLQDISQDFRFGARMLLKDRRFTLAAVLALGLGIGINNSVFTIMNAALFRDLPFEEADRLVDPRLVDSLVDSPGRSSGLSYADYLDWTRAATSFEGLMADQSGSINLSEDGRSAERMRGTYVTANTFRLLRVAPLLGRDFRADDDQIGAPPTVMLGYDVWQTRYGGDPGILGRTVRMNSVPATIIGVMPPEFTYPLIAQVWQPVAMIPNLNPENRSIRNLNVVGRLAPGKDIARAHAELQSIAAQIAQAHPDTHKNLFVTMASLQEERMSGSQAWSIFLTLMGAVTFVLLIACANVSSLLLARSTHRAREIAVRAALGASRWRIIRQMLIECLMISLLAAMAGLWFSRFGAGLMANAFNIYEIGAASAVKPYWANIDLDAITMTFVGAVALVVSIAVGLIPSWHLSSTSVNDVLKEGGRAGGATVRARRATGALLIGQLALTLILLTGAGLLARSYYSLYTTDLVVDTRGIVTMRMVLPAPKYAPVERQRQFVAALDQRLSALPMFSSYAFGTDIPLQPLGFNSRALAIEGRPWPSGQTPPEVFYVSVGERYLETLKLAPVRGRALTAADGRPGQEGVIVNERFAAKYFSGADAIGKRIRLTGQSFKPELAPWYTIVGISPAIPNFLRDRADEPLVYVPLQADPGSQRAISIIVRAADPQLGKAAAAEALRSEVTALDPDLPVFGIQTLEDSVAWSRFSSRTIGTWFLIIAGAALVLATVGLYALTAHSVAQRAHEIGVRMALGARSTQVLWLFVRRTVIQLAIGLTLGVAGALGIGRLLSFFLHDTDPRDPLTIVVVSLLLIVVALTASVWPARRAARVDPVEALRAD